MEKIPESFEQYIPEAEVIISGRFLSEENIDEKGIVNILLEKNSQPFKEAIQHVIRDQINMFTLAIGNPVPDNVYPQVDSRIDPDDEIEETVTKRGKETIVELENLLRTVNRILI